MTKIAEIATQLSEAAKTDSDAIQQIITKASDDIAAILAKYSDLPADVSLPALTNGRNAVASLRMYQPMPASLAPLMPPPTAIPVSA